MSRVAVTLNLSLSSRLPHPQSDWNFPMSLAITWLMVYFERKLSTQEPMIELWNVTLHFPTPRSINRRECFSPKASKTNSFTCWSFVGRIINRLNSSVEIERLSLDRNKDWADGKQRHRFLKLARNARKCFRRRLNDKILTDIYCIVNHVFFGLAV